MWKKIGIKTPPERVSDEQKQKIQRKKYKRIVPLSQNIEPNKHYQINVLNNISSKKTIIFDQFFLQSQFQQPNFLYSPRATSLINDVQLVSILKKRRKDQKQIENHFQMSNDQSANNYQKNQKSVRMRELDNSKLNKYINKSFFHEIYSEKAQNSTDKIMEEIIKLRNQLKMAVESNKIYKQFIEQFKLIVQNMSLYIKQELNKYYKQCTSTMMQIQKMWNNKCLSSSSIQFDFDNKKYQNDQFHMQQQHHVTMALSNKIQLQTKMTSFIENVEQNIFKKLQFDQLKTKQLIMSQENNRNKSVLSGDTIQQHNYSKLSKMSQDD